MKAFISYARRDAEIVELLRRDLEELCAVPPWIDRSVSGGQPWWDEILEQVRSADVFVFALSKSSLSSEACQSELRYALAVERHLLPVKVTPFDLAVAPDEIRQTQVIDYLERTPDTAIGLARAIMRLGPTPPLPSPLPPAPPMPESYGEPYRRQLAAKSIDLTGQAQLFAALKIHANVDEDRDEAVALLEMLRGRPDVTVAVAQEIDAFIAGQPAATALPPPTETPQPQQEGAPRPETGPIQLPVVQLIELLAPFRESELHVSPEIPEKAALNARKALKIPQAEPIVALANLAWFASGENALAVTDRALHHRKLLSVAHIPFDDLPGTEIKLDGSYIKIGDHTLGLGGTATASTVEAMVNAVVKACEARRARDAGSERPLTAAGWQSRPQRVCDCQSRVKEHVMPDLTAKKREKLPAKDFGLPEKARTKEAKKESGNYPMPDKAHARNAKSRAAQQEQAGNLTKKQRKRIDNKADKVLDD